MADRPSAEEQRAVRWLINRYRCRPMEVLGAYEQFLAGRGDDPYRHVVQSIALRTTSNILDVLEDEPDGTGFGGLPRAHFLELEKALELMQEALEAKDMKSSHLDRQEALKRQLWAPGAGKEAAETFAERLEQPDEVRLVELARSGKVLEAIGEVVALGGEPDNDLLEVLSDRTTDLLDTEWALKKDGWQARAEAAAAAFEGMTKAFWLAPFLGELTVSAIVNVAKHSGSDEAWAVAQRLTPLPVMVPSLAFRLARAYAGRGDKRSMLRFLKRACVLGRDTFEPDDPEFAPFLEDDDFKALLKAHPTMLEKSGFRWAGT